jgi:glycosyltransferase involved in cell wall biosynthesis
MEEGFAKATICLIPNGVDTDLFCPSESTDLDRKRIIFVGRLIYSKGVHVLLQALKLLIDDGIDAQLDVVGDGPERARLEDLANSLGISGSIAFHGNLYGVASLLQMSSVFVLPSFVEGLPNVVLEAMASGLPVVVTKVGGNPDLVNDGTNGVLVDADNPLQLRDALKELLENKDLAEKLGNEARKTIEQKFSIDHITDTYIKLYNDLIRNKS